MQLTRYSRGQTLIELIVAMPIALFALFGIIYFSRYAVVSDRAELTLRYGGIAGYATQGNAYGAAAIYQAATTGTISCPAPPVAILSGGGPMPGPTSAPFWQPDTDANVPAPSATCSPGAAGFGGSQFVASHFWSTTQVNVTAGIDVPSYLQGALGNNAATANTTATFIHAASPGIIMWCSTEVRSRVNGALTAQDSSPLPTPIPDGAPPPSPPPNNNGSCN